MFADQILEFTDYLNVQDYNVTPEKISFFFSLFSREDINCLDPSELIPAMKFSFCSNRRESEELPEHFHEFIKRKEKEKQRKDDIKNLKSRLAEANSSKESLDKDYTEKTNGIREQIESLKKEAQKQMQEVSDNWKDEVAFAKSDDKFKKENQKWIKSFKDPEMESIINGEIKSKAVIKKKQEALVKRMEAAMIAGNLKEVELCNKLFKVLDKVLKTAVNSIPAKQKAMDKAAKETLDEARKLEEKLQKEAAEHNRRQQEINNRIKELNRLALNPNYDEEDNIVTKKQSIVHRPEFVPGGHAVQTLVGCPECVQKPFKQLKESEKVLIERYLRDNLLKFKTRLTRNITDMENGAIDMLQTIQGACRTGGLPMKLYKKQRKPGKTNIVLVLDVSGSCKEASSMMLTFMWLLQEVFPRGCQAFAFVNSLYDITEVMKAEDPQTAIREVLGMIPRAGVYSNYEIPITRIWEDYRNTITHDSLVIFIGDARNNRNKSAETEFRNIARRAKKTYWLNTDVFAKWDEGDSIASTYAHYCKMFEILNTADIVNFIDNGIRIIN